MTGNCEEVTKEEEQILASLREEGQSRQEFVAGMLMVYPNQVFGHRVFGHRVLGHRVFGHRVCGSANRARISGVWCNSVSGKLPPGIVFVAIRSST